MKSRTREIQAGAAGRARALLAAGSAGLALAALTALAGCSQNGSVNAANRAASQPQPATVTRRDIVGQIPLTGEIVTPPSARADVLPPFHTAVEKVNKTVGDAVSKGDVLVQLSLPSAEQYHEQTKATLQQAETDYANAKNQYQAAVTAARKQLDAAQAAAKAAQQNSTTTYQPDGTVTTTTAPSAPSTPPAASSDVAAAQAELRQAQADYAANMLPYKQRLEEARAANAQARATEKQGYVRSPITGTVLALNAQPGKVVGEDAKQPIATVVDLSAIQVQSPMDANQASFVKKDMDVKLTFDEIPGKTFTGQVHQITTNPDTKQYVAVIQFANTDAQVKPGMHPRVGVLTGQKAEDALSVPAAAVDRSSDGKWTVQVQRNGKWETVPVEVGITDGQFTQIKSGVNEGDTVKVTP
jgi:multidrug efflux pump subunit AcrA (membrane-fusion protein)